MRATVVVWVAEAAVPVIVTVTGPPRVAAPLAVRVSVELPPAVTEVGLNEAVTPDGRPLAARATDSAEPETRAVLIVLVARGALGDREAGGIGADARSCWRRGRRIPGT